MKTSRIILLASALIGATALVSCEKAPDLAGSWTGNPQSIHNVNGAFTASSIDVLNFTDAEDGAQSGKVLISSMISAQQTVSGTPDLIEPYQETVAATASISGSWATDPDDKDEVNIVLDYNTLKVSVDPSGVAFSQNFITNREQPQLDSLTASAVSRWQESIYQALKPYYGRYLRLEDIKIKGSMMRAEIANDTEQNFTRESL